MVRSAPLVTGFLFVWASYCGAQETVSGDSGDSIKSLQQRIEAVKANTALDENYSKKIVDRFEDAITSLEQAETSRKTLATYREALKNGTAETQNLQAKTKLLEDSLKKKVLPGELNEQSDIESIERYLSSEQAALSDARSELLATQQALDQKQQSPSSNRERLIAIQVEVNSLEEANAEPSAVSADEGAALMAEAEQAARDANGSELSIEQEMLEQATLSYDIRFGEATAKRDLVQKNVEVLSKRVGALQDLANSRLDSEAAKAERLFEQIKKEEPKIGSPIEKLANDLEQLIQKTREVSQDLTDTKSKNDERTRVLEELRQDFTSVKRQVDLGGLEGAFAGVLLDRRKTIPSRIDERQRIRAIRAELRENQRNLYFLEQQNVTDPADTSKIPALAQWKGEVEEVIQTRDRLKKDLVTNYRRLIRGLGGLDLIEQQILQESTGFGDYLAEQLFWVRSSPFISLDTFRSLPAGLNWAYGPERVEDFIRQLKAIPVWFYVILSLFLVVTMAPRRWFAKQLVTIGQRTRRVSTDNYSNTVEAFFLTLLLAIPVPIVLSSFGLMFRYHAAASEWSFGLGSALILIGVFYFVVSFLDQISREKGLGEFHFDWDGDRLCEVRKMLRCVFPFYLLMVLTLCLVVADISSDHLNSLGRISALIGVVGVGIVFYRFLRAQRHLERESENSRKAQWVGFSFWANIVGVLTLTVCLIIGFVVTALFLMVEMQMTFLAFWMAFIIYGLVMRWFAIKARKLALKEAIEERHARLEALENDSEDEKTSGDSELGGLTLEAEEEMDLVEVGEQTRNLVGFLVGAGLLVALYYLWIEFVPVLTVLDRLSPFGSFSAADLAVTILVVAVTFEVTRNLPGLLEVIILRRLELDPGTRKSFTTLAQYGAVAIGAMVLFRHLGVDWSQFGWIAAALSVGLGFGLQEVVANFVCGIILLFERPIRVGDVVNVAGVSGTVSKIQMRATTIINWDREEFVVPNKEFITGSLINMTLSSPINRIMIPVGVAYGSDTEEVLRILSEVSREDDEIMDDPAPVITFEGFGESSLDFFIRAYLPNRDNRLGVITFLHKEIEKRLSEAEIEIPFPQRDLHLRSIDEGVSLSKSAKSKIDG